MRPARCSRRTALQLLLAATSAPATLRAQVAYPSRTIRLVVPFAPGGGPDVLTRQFLPRMNAALGQTVFVDNRVGAGGIIAAEYVALQPPDGYTLLLGASTHVTQKVLQPKAPFDPVKGFSHVTRLSYAPSVLVVAGDSPWRSLDDLLRAARARPGKLNYGSGGVGSAAHLAGAALATQAKVDVTHIPYRGSVDLPGALIAGDLQFAIPTASTVLPHLPAGKLRALAVTSAQREPLLPNVPTLKELTGSDDLVLVAWSGVWLPAGAPPAVVHTLFDAHAKVYADPEIVKAHAALGVTISLSASEAEFSEFVAAETAKITRIVKAARIETT
jgi:tripartite-type tricarboxylate transporter receptor subunit TctC